MPTVEYTDTPLEPRVKDVLELGIAYDWKIVSTEERITPKGNALMEFSCKERETEATSRMTLFFTPKTAPQITRFLRACGIERAIGETVNVTDELVKGRVFAAKLKEGTAFVDKEGKTVVPWEIDGFSCQKPTVATSSTPAPSPAPQPAAKDDKAPW
jgi:hypothetical protein